MRYSISMPTTPQRIRPLRWSALVLLTVLCAACAACAACTGAAPAGSPTAPPTPDPALLGVPGGSDPRETSGPAVVVAASTPVLADIIRAALGPRAEVWSVVPVNGDPHTYEATARELERIGTADLYIQMGANLERYEESGAWRRAVQDAEVPVLRLADHLELITKDLVIDHGDHVHDLRAGDPHVWLDPGYVRRIAILARDAVIELDPAGRASYESAAAAYDAELARLETELEQGIATIPSGHRQLVVLHDAYAYFAARFGFEVIGYVTRNPGQEPSAADVADLVRIVRDTGVPAVFAEPQLDATVLEMVAAETGVAVRDLLTDSFTAEVGTYLDLMRYDLAELTRSLGEPATGP